MRNIENRAGYPVRIEPALQRAINRVAAQHGNTQTALAWIGPDDTAPAGCRGVHYQPYESQAAWHQLTAPFRAFSGPVGSGKTMSLIQEVVRLCYGNPGLPGMLIAPTYSLLRDASQAILFEVLDSNAIPYRQIKSRNEVVLSDCKSTIICRSADDPESLRGSNIAWLAADELSYISHAAWDRAIARVRHPNAQNRACVAALTPRGRDWTFQSFRSPDKHASYDFIAAKPFENRAILDKDPLYYKRLEESYDSKFYKQEVLGEIVAGGAGQVYYSFDRAVNVRDDIDFAHWQPVWIACDFNIDPGVALILQPKSESYNLANVLQSGVVPDKPQEILVLQEVFLRNAPTDVVFDEVWKRIQPWKLKEITLFADSTGKGRESSTGSTNFAVIENWAQEHRLKINRRIPSRNPDIEDRVNSMNAALKNASDGSRLFVHPSCKELIADLESVTWGPDQKHLDASDKLRTHISDGLGYCVAQVLPVHKQQAQNPWKLIGF